MLRLDFVIPKDHQGAESDGINKRASSMLAWALSHSRRQHGRRESELTPLWGRVELSSILCNWTLALTQPIRVSQSSDIITPIKPLDLLKPVLFHHAVGVSGTEPMLAWNIGFLLLHQTRLPGGLWGSRNLGITGPSSTESLIPSAFIC